MLTLDLMNMETELPLLPRNSFFSAVTRETNVNKKGNVKNKRKRRERSQMGSDKRKTLNR